MFYPLQPIHSITFFSTNSTDTFSFLESDLSEVQRLIEANQKKDFSKERCMTNQLNIDKTISNGMTQYLISPINLESLQQLFPNCIIDGVKLIQLHARDETEKTMALSDPNLMDGMPMPTDKKSRIDVDIPPKDSDYCHANTHPDEMELIKEPTTVSDSISSALQEPIDYIKLFQKILKENNIQLKKPTDIAFIQAHNKKSWCILYRNQSVVCYYCVKGFLPKIHTAQLHIQPDRKRSKIMILFYENEKESLEKEVLETRLLKKNKKYSFHFCIPKPSKNLKQFQTLIPARTHVVNTFSDFIFYKYELSGEVVFIISLKVSDLKTSRKNYLSKQTYLFTNKNSEKRL